MLDCAGSAVPGVSARFFAAGTGAVWKRSKRKRWAVRGVFRRLILAKKLHNRAGGGYAAMQHQVAAQGMSYGSASTA
jgi:hypothetical protein